MTWAGEIILEKEHDKPYQLKHHGDELSWDHGSIQEGDH